MITFSGQDAFAATLAVDISADPATIEYGSPVTLSWVAENAITVRIDNGIGAVEDVDTLTLTPTGTTTYTITVRKGLFLLQKATDSVTVTVLPKIESFGASAVEIHEGESVTLSWEALGAESCTISPSPGPVGLSGTATLQPSGDTTYTLTAMNGSGDSTETVFVSVIPRTIKSYDFQYDSAGRIKSIQVNETE